MSTVTRIAIRFAQILTLAVLLVGLAGGTKPARAAADVDCEEATPWIEETLERNEVIEEYHEEFGRVYTLERVLALAYHGIGLFEELAEEQAASNPPEAQEGLNDDLVEALTAVSYALSDVQEATTLLDTEEAFEANDRVVQSKREVANHMIYVERLAGECEDVERERERENRGQQNENDDRRDNDNARRGGEDEDAVEVEATVVDLESEEPIEGAVFIVLEEGVDFEDFDQAAFFVDGDEDQVLALGYSDEAGEIAVEAEVAIDAEYTIVLAHEDYRNLSYWSDVVIATDEDAETVEFGTVALGGEPEEED